MVLDIIKTPFIQKINGQAKQLYVETSADQVVINNASGTASTLEAEIQALRQSISNVSGMDALVFKGILNADSELPTTDYKKGWFYKIGTAGSYAGQTCEVGDSIYCTEDYVEGTASNNDWAVLQGNLSNTVTGPETAVADNIPAFSNTLGTGINDSGLSKNDVQNAITYSGKLWAKAVKQLPEEAELTTLLNTLHEGAIVVVDSSLTE